MMAILMWVGLMDRGVGVPERLVSRVGLLLLKGEVVRVWDHLSQLRIDLVMLLHWLWHHHHRSILGLHRHWDHLGLRRHHHHILRLRRIHGPVILSLLRDLWLGLVVCVLSHHILFGLCRLDGAEVASVRVVVVAQPVRDQRRLPQVLLLLWLLLRVTLIARVVEAFHDLKIKILIYRDIPLI
jgi:hypothetical protein